MILNPMTKAIRALMGTAISSSRLDEGQIIVDRDKFEEMVATYRREHFADETAHEYTPTTMEVIRNYRLPGWVLEPQKPDESFAEYIGRISVEGHAAQVASERAASRWIAEHDRMMRESAWDSAIKETHACGWLNDFDRDDMVARNPHRGEAS